jgi:hypothetical protein
MDGGYGAQQKRASHQFDASPGRRRALEQMYAEGMGGRPGQRVVAAITDVLIIRERHPALFARVAKAGASCIELIYSYDFYLNGISTPYWFATDGFPVRERLHRRAAGKRQRQARKIQRRAS